MPSLLEDPASKFYKYIVVYVLLCLAISVILNTLSIQSMNHNIWVSSLARLGPKGIHDMVFESWFKLRMWYSGI